MNRRALAAAAVLLVAACATSATTATPKGTIAGRVLSAPSCPVERQGVPCPPRPVSDATVVALRAGEVIASTRADSRGYFHIDVADGRYNVRATNTGGYRSTASKVVVIWAERRMVYVRLVVDSGIR